LKHLIFAAINHFSVVNLLLYNKNFKIKKGNAVLAGIFFLFYKQSYFFKQIMLFSAIFKILKVHLKYKGK
jgi:hypothetical protein